MKKNKKLYKVEIMKYVIDFQKEMANFMDGELVKSELILSREVQVMAYDVSQAIRKVKYNLTKQGAPILDNEFIDSINRIGTIEIK